MITADVVVARAAAVVAVAAVVVAHLTIQTAPGHRPPTRTCGAQLFGYVFFRQLVNDVLCRGQFRFLSLLISFSKY